MICAFNHSKTPPIFVPALCLIVAILVVGCSPPPPQTAEIRLSVGMPDADPGKLTDAPIAPPALSNLDGTTARAVAMRIGNASQLVQKKGGREPGAIEIVATPAPDESDSPKPKPKPRIDAEVVPTPDGVAVGKIPTTSGDTDRTNIPVVVAANPVLAPDAFPDGIDGPEDYRTWETPDVALVITGQQHGYIEPCGCTGLDRQKGGVARRFTFMRQLRDKGWTLVPLDAGNLVRRFGRQAAVKLQQTVKALKLMDYQAIGFGPDDLRLGLGELLAVAAGETADETMYASANVVLVDSSLTLQTRLIEKKGRKIGVTSVLDPKSLEVAASDEILVEPKVEAARKALAELTAAESDFKVLLFYGKEDAGQQLVRDVPGFDLLVAAGGYGEPTYQAESIEGSKTRMIVTGNKGMYAGLIGLYADGPLKYARVPLTHEFDDAPEMRKLMKEYQDQLRDIGLKGLGLLPPIPHSSGQQFVGSAKCGECHTTAYEIWQGTPHAEATEHIVRPPAERSDVARHFDPECISCHVTGWNPQEYYPYSSGYLSLEASEHLTGSGCENCHGPGSEHAAAEAKDATVATDLRDSLREAMKLPLEKAREKCMKCHDLDNSPDFHETDAFEDVYWPEVEHDGLD